MMSLTKRLWTRDQIVSHSAPLESQFQIGEEVKCWISKDITFIALVCGVNFSPRNIVSYDLAVQIGNTGWYTTLCSVRGEVTKLDGVWPGEEGGLVDVATYVPAPTPSVDKPGNLH